MKNKLWSGFLCIVMLACLAAVNSVPTFADTTESEKTPVLKSWETVGPNGGDVRSLTIDPNNKNTFYFGTIDGQIYTSSDAGKNWRLLVNFNLPQVAIDSLLVDSRDSKTIYAGGHRHIAPGGFFKSSDGGATWRKPKELEDESVYAITQSKSNPDMIVVGTAKGVFRSLDSGNKFESIS